MMGDMRRFRIGDLVRPTESSVADVGEVVNLREGDYVIVQWHGSNRSTHHCRSLEPIGPGAGQLPRRVSSSRTDS
jgi:hypothetical protein